MALALLYPKHMRLTGVSSRSTSEWTRELPVLEGRGVTLRELRLEGASSLLVLLTATEVAQFISPPPKTVAGFEQFILWAQHERQAGTYACFAVVPVGSTTAIGLFQLRSLDRAFTTAEWGFAIGSPFWGTGAFAEGARLVIDFAVDVVGTERLEARAAVANGRGNGALRKLGAVQEAMLRRSFTRGAACYDQVLWGILAKDWRLQRLPQRPTTRPH